MNRNDPFELLLDLERRTVKTVEKSSALNQVKAEWIGVGFRVGNSRLIASMVDIKEILNFPAVTSIPGVKSWVVGVANVRGSLLPIMDMKGFLLGQDIKQRQKARVIVIDYKGINTGLVVDEVFGMRHFRVSDTTTETPDVPEVIVPYIEKVYKQDDEHWPVFSFNEMAQDERFAQASLK